MFPFVVLMHTRWSSRNVVVIFAMLLLLCLHFTTLFPSMLYRMIVIKHSAITGTPCTWTDCSRREAPRPCQHRTPSSGVANTVNNGVLKKRPRAVKTASLAKDHHYNDSQRRGRCGRSYYPARCVARSTRSNNKPWSLLRW